MTLTDGETLPVELEISSDVLRIVANGSSIGAWPIRYCRVSPRSSGVFDISIDGEVVTFVASDTAAFAQIAAGRFVSSPLSDRIAAVKTLPAVESVDFLPPPPPEPEFEDQPKLESRRMIVGAGLAAVVVTFVFAVTQLRSTDEPLVPTTISATVTTVQPPAAWFELTPEEFGHRWNLTAERLAVSAVLPTANTGQGFDVTISEWIYAQGTVDDEGRMESLVITVDPTGPDSSDEHAVLVWGLAMTVADPAGAPAERRTILERLGVDLNSLQLEGVDSGLDWGRNRYFMQYLPALSSILLRIEAAD